jgi:hypothetical protein
VDAAAAANRSTVGSFPWGADTNQMAENAEAMLQKTLSEVLGDSPPVPVEDACIGSRKLSSTQIIMPHDADG